MGFGGILVIFRFQRYFGHFLEFRGTLVMLRFWVYFGHFNVSRVFWLLELGIEIIKYLIIIHPYFFKTCGKPLKLGIFYSLGTLICVLKDCPYFICTLSAWDLLKLLVSHSTKQGIQCPIVEVCSFDYVIIPRCGWISRFGPSKPSTLFHLKTAKKLSCIASSMHS